MATRFMTPNQLPVYLHIQIVQKSGNPEVRVSKKTAQTLARLKHVDVKHRTLCSERKCSNAQYRIARLVLLTVFRVQSADSNRNREIPHLAKEIQNALQASLDIVADCLRQQGKEDDEIEHVLQESLVLAHENGSKTPLIQLVREPLPHYEHMSTDETFGASCERLPCSLEPICDDAKNMSIACLRNDTQVLLVLPKCNILRANTYLDYLVSDGENDIVLQGTEAPHCRYERGFGYIERPHSWPSSDMLAHYEAHGTVHDLAKRSDDDTLAVSELWQFILPNGNAIDTAIKEAVSRIIDTAFGPDVPFQRGQQQQVFSIMQMMVLCHIETEQRLSQYRPERKRTIAWLGMSPNTYRRVRDVLESAFGLEWREMV